MNLKESLIKLIGEKNVSSLLDFYAKNKVLFEGQDKKEDKLKDGTVIRYEGELKEGVGLMVVTAEGEMAAPDGQMQMTDGTELTISEGKVTAIKKPEAKEEVKEEKPEVKENKDETMATLTKENEAAKLESEKLKTDLATANTKIEAIEKESAENKTALSAAKTETEKLTKEFTDFKKDVKEMLALVKIIAESPNGDGQEVNLHLQKEKEDGISDRWQSLKGKKLFTD